MNTTLNINLSTALHSRGKPRPADGSTDSVGNPRALSERELVDLAERHGIAGDRSGLDAARNEAERRAHGQSPDGVAAQIAGYLSLLAEDTEHVLAEEAHAWGVALRGALATRPADASKPASPAIPASREAASRILGSVVPR